MISYELLTPGLTVGMNQRMLIAAFLHKHLDEFGDEKEDILKCIDYALDDNLKPGGFVLVAHDQEKDKIVGTVVVNRTGMEGYIPENILVYIAMHKDYRGQGIGKQLMQKAIDSADGNIALHVEPENPAVHLYKKLGFTNKYLEMRLVKN
ncbi:GNAT family N-acetyltransferase [Imperialibacter roseus]|uniref:GNAT family N-acetyltransferase n=1 Tax=Imperialibacter roseus TaxID=1324217 RepID=A0ABZ0IMB0_9BACT|nr:GNAT family N-acetyltransferase [Imperialibacter roseus]WOK05652.1 GNAT family N-acetyltransferase [Imperialibacter roseus]|tara:strand:+ start:16334 stop:16783 length:450 start_codon:yes stop_codon:yes gene_type:complete